jgi:hypothetical protein
VVVSQVEKVPAGGEIRVHEMYGGVTRPVAPTGDAGLLAERAVACAAGRLGADLAYARVDVMAYDGRLVVSELELIEPGLYLDVLPGNAQAFADVVASRVGDR